MPVSIKTCYVPQHSTVKQDGQAATRPREMTQPAILLPHEAVVPTAGRLVWGIKARPLRTAGNQSGRQRMKRSQFVCPILSLSCAIKSSICIVICEPFLLSLQNVLTKSIKLSVL